MRKKVFISVGIVFVLLCCFIGGKHLLTIKQYIPEIEQKARESQNVPDTWEAVSETTDDVAAVLFYDPDSREHIFAVYSSSSDIGTIADFSLIAGGAIPVNQADIVELYSSEFDEYIYASMNRQKACLLQITSDGKFSTIQIDPDKPFVIMVSPKEGEAIFYDKDNQVIAVDSLKL